MYMYKFLKQYWYIHVHEHLHVVTRSYQLLIYVYMHMYRCSKQTRCTYMYNVHDIFLKYTTDINMGTQKV